MEKKYNIFECSIYSDLSHLHNNYFNLSLHNINIINNITKKINKENKIIFIGTLADNIILYKNMFIINQSKHYYITDSYTNKYINDKNNKNKYYNFFDKNLIILHKHKNNIVFTINLNGNNKLGNNLNIAPLSFYKNNNFCNYFNCYIEKIPITILKYDITTFFNKIKNQFPHKNNKLKNYNYDNYISFHKLGNINIFYKNTNEYSYIYYVILKEIKSKFNFFNYFTLKNNYILYPKNT